MTAILDLRDPRPIPPAGLPDNDDRRAGRGDVMTLTTTVALHRLARSWTVCDSCEMRIAVYMVRAYDWPRPFHHAASAIWLVCDECAPPDEMVTPWTT